MNLPIPICRSIIPKNHQLITCQKNSPSEFSLYSALDLWKHNNSGVCVVLPKDMLQIP